MEKDAGQKEAEEEEEAGEEREKGAEVEREGEGNTELLLNLPVGTKVNRQKVW